MLLLAGVAVGCNDDISTSTTESYNDCVVSTFSLQRDDSVASHLDSVFFSIDLVNARIFNADSLPVGTKISHLLVKVGTESASSVKITFLSPTTQSDTTVNLIDNPNDSINFADGPVKLEITSFNGVAKRTYDVQVNVHNSIPDTLYWAEDAIRDIPSSLTAPTVQKSVVMAGIPYCFTSDGTTASLAVLNDPFGMAAGMTDIVTPELPEGFDITSIEATDDAFYGIDAQENLYRSADGVKWAATGTKMTALYGGYGTRVLGALSTEEGWKHVTYPPSAEVDVPAGCPVKGSSNLVLFTSKWNISPTAVTLGGVKADGTVTGDAWAFDGSVWAKLSNSPAPAMQGAVLFPYNTPRTSSFTWRVTEESVLVAMGGKLANGAMNDTVYVSGNFGISWTKARDMLQLPDYMPRVTDADVAVIDHKFTIDDTAAAVQSRVVAPVTEWECPFIYYFGGIDASGALVPTFRRGVINRFTFKPLY